jgi:hypothetical protein
MAQDPVTVAASNNPVLTTLTQAVSGQLNPNVNLVDTLNGGVFTVFGADRRRVRQDRPGDDREALVSARADAKTPDTPRVRGFLRLLTQKATRPNWLMLRIT